MNNLPHLRIPSKQAAEKYTNARRASHDVIFNHPGRIQSVHAVKVRTELEGAQIEAGLQRAANRQAYPQLVQWQPQGGLIQTQ